MDWIKAQRMEALSTFIKEGSVDRDILPLLDLINGRENSFTTSSCAGRIALIELPELGDKRQANFLGKWHREIDSEDFRIALKKYQGELLLYLLVQPPILHVYCRTGQEAKEIITLGRESGFKDSSFRGLELPYLVALVTTEHLNVPIAASGIIFPDDNYINFLVGRANAAFQRARGKLKRLEDALRESSLQR